MPTSRMKAESFIRDLQKSEAELREKYGLDREDVVVNVSITIHERVIFSSVEDEK